MTRRVAVLGAGIMGSTTAILLARRGIEVVLYEAAARPFSGASRWNEGKIHLGFLYAADPSLRTARRILPGALTFRPLLEELLGCRLTNVTEEDDTFLVHRDSVVDLSSMRAYFASLQEMVRAHPAAKDYLVDLSRASARELTRTEVAEVADLDSVVGGFAVPERSISTQWVADAFVQALIGEPKIELRTASRVLGVKSARSKICNSVMINTQSGSEGPYDAVVNATWEGRLAIDASIGLLPQHEWSHRYRVSLFARTRQPVEAVSAILCTGAFGDIKNYNGRDFYLSWYRAGLLASGEGIDPPPVPPLDATESESIAEEVFGQLGQIIPVARKIQSLADQIRVEGGWVFASGRGELSDPCSTLHQRYRIGVARLGSYYSVDTGKYSMAPLLARKVADAIVD